jgi:hypothetical protein
MWLDDKGVAIIIGVLIGWINYMINSDNQVNNKECCEIYLIFY